MTLKELIRQREDISLELIEADSIKIATLEQELIWVEELIKELEGEKNGKEKSKTEN